MDILASQYGRSEKEWRKSLVSIKSKLYSNKHFAREVVITENKVETVNQSFILYGLGALD